MNDKPILSMHLWNQLQESKTNSMTTDNDTIVEYTKIIAVFCGWHYSKSGNTVRKDSYSSPYKLKGIKYTSSYDWIMEAIDKIESIWYPDIPENITEKTIFRKKNLVLKMRIDTPIKEVINNIVQFINWYNSTQSIHQSSQSK